MSLGNRSEGAALEVTQIQPRRRFGRLAWSAVACTYGLIVLGGVVRITGSGMACGEDWPLCRGRFLPTRDAPTLLEYGHRRTAAAVAVLVFAVGTYALRHRRRPPFPDRYGLLHPALLAVALLVAQVFLGAVTVRWALPAGVVSLHLVTAMALLATLLVAAVRASPSRRAAPSGAQSAPADRAARARAAAATGAVALGFLVVALGAVVANTGAGPLCAGFPLCSGQLIPSGGGLAHVHWTHRLLAYLLLIHVVGAAVAVWRRRAAPVPSALRWSASGAAVLVALQTVVAAALVLARLPTTLRAGHLAIGTAAWAALVLWATWARRANREAKEPTEPVRTSGTA